MSVPPPHGHAALLPLAPACLTLTGGLGQRYAGHLAYLQWRGRDLDRLLFPFEHRDEWQRVRDWDGEYLGKWLDAAVRTADLTGDPTLLRQTTEAATRLRATQEADGYLGTELPAHRFRPDWPLWMHWLAMKGLREYGQRRHDDACVQAAIRGGDWFVSQFHPLTDSHSALFACRHGVLAILDELAELHAITGAAPLLDLAAAAIAHYPPFQAMRASGKAPPMHAYSLLTYLGGAALVAHARGDGATLAWLTATWDELATQHLYPTGSVSTNEHLAQPPSDLPNGHLQETCATVEWLIFTQRLYGITGEPRYAHMIERTVRNALLAAQSCDGKKWTYFTPLRTHKEWLIGPTDCCFFSGPRGLARLPDLLYHRDAEGLRVDLFESSTVTVRLHEQAVTLVQESAYPAVGRVTLCVQPAQPLRFTLKLRLPEHTTNAQVQVNGQPVALSAAAGAYLVLDRTWQPRDTVLLTFDPCVWQARLHDQSALVLRGIEVLSFDRRDNETDYDQVRLPTDPLVAPAPSSSDGRPRYRVTADVAGQAVPLLFTPYADAGNATVGVMAGHATFRTAFPPSPPPDPPPTAN